MTDTNLPAVPEQPDNAPVMAFSSIASFEKAQRMARALSSSDLVPQMYKGDKGLANCLIAMEVAARTGSSILSVVQNLNIIQGKPSWGSSYVIGALNSCGRFTAINLVVDGEGDARGCTATSVIKDTGERVEGPRVSIKMAKDEGWYGRAGSKWKTMPDLMLRYRAAAFFGRLYAPDILMGMQSQEEAEDIAPPRVVNPTVQDPDDVKDAEALAERHTDAAEQNDNGESKPTTRRRRKKKGADAPTDGGQEAAATDGTAEGEGAEPPPPPVKDPEIVEEGDGKVPFTVDDGDQDGFF